MSPDEFTHPITKQFIQETENIDEFFVERYTTPTMTKEELEQSKLENHLSIPVRIINFPWNEEFEGLEFQIGQVNIEESEDKKTARLSYHYNVQKNPNELDIANQDETSKLTADNELLDVFIGRLVESLLYRMSQDEEFLQNAKENIEKEAGEGTDE